MSMRYNSVEIGFSIREGLPSNCRYESCGLCKHTHFLVHEGNNTSIITPTSKKMMRQATHKAMFGPALARPALLALDASQCLQRSVEHM